MKYPATATYIKQARIDLGLSASAFARLAFAASGSHVRQWERGEIRPGKAAMELIRRALEIRPTKNPAAHGSGRANHFG